MRAACCAERSTGSFQNDTGGGRRRSALVPPERLAAFVATSPAQMEQDMVAEMVEAIGERAASPQAVFFRRWGVDPWTEGYIELAARRRDGRRTSARDAR